MHESLKDIKVLVTRPDQQAENLCKLIEENGGQAIRFPVIDIQPSDNRDENIKLIENFSKYEIAIFVSRNAVLLAQSLPGFDKIVLAKINVVATGAGTAEQLRKAGIRQVIYAKGQSDSESLLALPEFKDINVKGKSIIIFRGKGKGGRELLGETLTERGAIIDYADVYQRVCPHYDRDFIGSIWNINGPDIIVVTSCEALQNLIDMLSSKQKMHLLNKQVVTIGKRIVDMANRMGFKKQPILAEGTSDAGILNSIKKYREISLYE
jgi:uroporphyrinogen-III synthase